MKRQSFVSAFFVLSFFAAAACEDDEWPKPSPESSIHAHTPPPPPFSCTGNKDCADDGDSCTDEVCAQMESGAYACLAIPFFCDDGNPCTEDSCYGDDGVPQCVIEPLPAGEPCGQNASGELQTCQDGACKPIPTWCVPNCMGKSCGANGCGGSCGSCPQTFACSCQGATIVCSGTTGACTKAYECQDSAQITDCNDGNDCTVGDTCAMSAGGEPTCAYLVLDGTSCNDGNVGTGNDTCVDGMCTGFVSECVASCSGKMCGGNGCGGSCGGCSLNEVCYGSICREDDDQDGVADAFDNCDGAPNPSQIDSDQDGSGNACDCAPFDPSAHPKALEVCGNGKDENCSGGDLPCPSPQPAPLAATAAFGPFDYPYAVTDQAFCGLVRLYGKTCGINCSMASQSVANLESMTPVAILDLGTEKKPSYPQSVVLTGSIYTAGKLLFGIRHRDARHDGECFTNEVSWGLSGPPGKTLVVEISGQQYTATPEPVVDGYVWVVNLNP